MAKLYPPYIEGVLPAFCLNVNGDGEIVIPFANNKAVSTADIGGMAIKVKSVQNDILIDDFSVSLDQIQDNEIHLDVANWKLEYNESQWDIVVQRYWKLQIAYKDKSGIVGYYSTVGVIKCTSEPTVYIDGFEENMVNANNNEFIGVYRQEAGGDITEKVYSSEFIITDIKGNVVVTSGEILHNVENNPNSYESHDIMAFNRDLEFGEIYEIVYKVKTNNGLEFSSPRYKLTQQKSLNMELKGSLVATADYDDGYVDISIEGYVDPDTNKEEIGLGAFVLTREDALNPGYWNELYRFTLNYESPTKTIFRDFTVEQGKTYTYSIQQYNARHIYSSRRKSNSVTVDFEDMFLFDGERQLKLRFNPQVNSFKTQLAESKTDTIGSKYPFFFRNARVGYKTFPISGLISMLTDDNQFFIKYDDILRENFESDRHNVNTNKKIMPRTYPHTDLIAENFVSERLFKLEVLDWINDGKVKLFRSPGEGNYLVRLMDNSLTPQIALGRMIHTLNGTAYECAENTHFNLVQYGIVEDGSDDDSTAVGQVLITNWNELRLDDPIIQDLAIRLREEKNSSSMDENAMGVSSDVEEEAKNSALFQALLLTGTPPHSKNLIMTDMGDNAYTTHLRFEDVIPGTKFRLVFSQPASFDSRNHLDIVIGSTGAYYADDIEKVYGIYYIGEYNNTPDPSNPAVIKIGDEYAYLPASGSGTITYEHETIARSSNMFDSVEDIKTDIGAYAQLVGEKEVIKSLMTTKEQVTQIAISNYFKRPVEYLYYNESSLTPITGNIFESNLDTTGYRVLNNVYDKKLFWNLDDLLKKKVYKFKKKPNTNGLSEDWWNVLDWAEYYAKIEALKNGKNPDALSMTELRNYYPDKTLGNYRNSEEASFYPSKEDNQAILKNYTFVQGRNEDDNAQVIWVDEESKTWGMHVLNCGHIYTDFLPNGRIFNEGAPNTALWYVYKPMFPGELSMLDSEGVVDLSDYMKLNYFDDQENMEYSPFSLYVLRNNKFGKENILTHFQELGYGQNLDVETTHNVDHLFERYYIDRYINAQSAEEMLTERTLLAKRLGASSDETTSDIEEATALYVLDPWYGKVYEVGKDFMYNPSITYRNSNIDLREIQRYSLDNLDPENGEITIGNGVYGDIFYQKVTLVYDIESQLGIDYDNIYTRTKEIMETEIGSTSYAEYIEEKMSADKIKDKYNEELQSIITNWTKKQS